MNREDVERQIKELARMAKLTVVIARPRRPGELAIAVNGVGCALLDPAKSRDGDVSQTVEFVWPGTPAGKDAGTT